MPELALNDDQRDAPVSHLYRVSVAELVRREAATHTSHGCCASQLLTSSGLLPVSARGGAVNHAQPLLATKTGDTVLVVASKAGAIKHPAWYHNVRANLDVEVTIDGQRRPMRAEIAAEGEERDRLWRVVCDNYSGYATYQRRASSRVIPVVGLRPR